MQDNGASNKAKEAVILNACFWGVGNGLISTSLIIYLIRDICAENQTMPVGTVIAWIVAAPRIAGLLRLAVPWLIDRFGSRKWFTVLAFTLSPLVLLGIPLGLAPLIHHASLTTVLGLLVVIWCVYHLIEYFGTIALWAMIGDLVPSDKRGRFLGIRDGMMILGQMLGFLASGLYAYFVIDSLPKTISRWEGYLLPTYFGIACLVLAVIPLLRLPEVLPEGLGRKTSGKLWEPLRNRRFVIFVLFGMYLQVSGGLSQSVQHNYQVYVLHLSLLFSLLTQTLTRIGQSAIAPWSGRSIDRFGFFPTMCVSLVIVSGGSLCYFFAEPSSWWLVYVAALFWIFWVGVNVGISTLVLNLSPPENKASGIAIFYTASTLSFAISTLLGGYWSDHCRDWVFSIPAWQLSWNCAQCNFLASFVLRLSAVLFLPGIVRAAIKKP
ncbi:MAG: MFS transporter [Planctomycetaceae bacterium]|nr:MFS transporter [Planctomycetaceae bacterium]